MKKTALLTALLLLLALPAGADWLGVVRCQGQPPTCLNPVVVPKGTVLTPPIVVAPPVVTSPPVVVVPPVVTSPVGPPAKPPVDTSIFVFPPQPPLGADNPAQRAQILWTTPEGDNVYAVLPEFRNPLPGSHLLAGALPRTEWPGFVVNAGSNLWVPAYAGQRYPGQIRRLLRGEVL